MRYSFDSAATPSRRTVQYFEMLGNRGIYQDGWMASARHGRLPWQTAGGGGSFDDDTWELYRLSDDFTQATDVSAQNPEKVKELQAAFLEEAKKYNVLPLDDRMSERFDASLRPNPLAGLTSFSYGPGTTNISKFGRSQHARCALQCSGGGETGGANVDGVLAAIGGVTSAGNSMSRTASRSSTTISSR